jgi:hypothetical protein
MTRAQALGARKLNSLGVDDTQATPRVRTSARTPEARTHGPSRLRPPYIAPCPPSSSPGVVHTTLDTTLFSRYATLA